MTYCIPKEHQQKTDRRKKAHQPTEDQQNTNNRKDLQKTDRRKTEDQPTENWQKASRWPTDDQQMTKR